MANTIGNKYGVGQKGGPNRMTKELRVFIKRYYTPGFKRGTKRI